jgi:ABC-type Fe3+-hydroxamate transport system substrate-binding protein
LHETDSLMPLYTDQLGRTIEIKQTPKRIISLVPSQTELLFDLGLDEEVIGITKFCVHPQHWFQTKTRTGGTKQLHLDKIKELQPDLIIANKEENVREQIEELSKDFPVWISDVNNLTDALKMIISIGDMVNKPTQAKEITHQIKRNFGQLQTPNYQLQTYYLIWKDPYMTIGGDTFINDMLHHAGFENIFGNEKRYPQVSPEQLQNANCQLLLLSSEPFPFQQKHIDELQPLLPDTKIILVDGEMFSWYGSRLLKAPAYFQQLQNQVLSLSHARGTE